MVMKSVGTAHLKAHLSEHLRLVRAGEVITILDRNQPVARIVPLSDDLSELVVRPGRGRLGEIRVPPPVDSGPDILEDLLAERGDQA